MYIDVSSVSKADYRLQTYNIYLLKSSFSFPSPPPTPTHRGERKRKGRTKILAARYLTYNRLYLHSPHQI